MVCENKILRRIIVSEKKKSNKDKSKNTDKKIKQVIDESAVTETEVSGDVKKAAETVESLDKSIVAEAPDEENGFIYTTQMKQYDEMIQRENATHEKKEPLLRRFMTAFGNIFALNICFIIACLGVVTIGAAITALFSMCIRLQEGNSDAMIIKEYFTEFKKNFKKATLEWLIVIGILGVMFAEYLLVLTQPGVIAGLYTVVLVAELIVLALVMAFLFPLTARYENTIINTFKNALLLSLGNLWDFAKIFLIWFVPLYYTIKNPVIFFLIWYLYLLIAFGTMAYLSTMTIRNVFKKIKVTQEEEQKKREDQAYASTHSDGVAARANALSKYTGNKTKPVDNKTYSGSKNTVKNKSAK
ncbi:MAG TPA: hypothetical protein DEO87_07590 [Lachnospiraceae bacterium]|nr:hypothetical protein [Lachnospiraceae bacterium]